MNPRSAANGNATLKPARLMHVMSSRLTRRRCARWKAQTETDAPVADASFDPPPILKFRAWRSLVITADQECADTLSE